MKSSIRTGRPLRRSRRLLRWMKREDVTNTVWLTADVHYCAAHYYDPNKAVFQDFDPFWEFVAGPIHAGNFGPNALDPTFGPEVKFQWSRAPGQSGLAPWDGLQSFGIVDVTRDAVSVAIVDIDDRERYRVELPAV